MRAGAAPFISKRNSMMRALVVLALIGGADGYASGWYSCIDYPSECDGAALRARAMGVA